MRRRHRLSAQLPLQRGRVRSFGKRHNGQPRGAPGPLQRRGGRSPTGSLGDGGGSPVVIRSEYLRRRFCTFEGSKRVYLSSQSRRPSVASYERRGEERKKARYERRRCYSV